MYKLLPFVLALFATACAPDYVKPAQPAWISNPEMGAVGTSTTHVKGRHYQEDLAISRAREKLAARLGVKITMDQTIIQKVSNDTASVTSHKETGQSIRNKEVKARVRETWHDTAQDRIWVWVYPAN